MDSTAQTASRDSEIINELVSRVTHGFDSLNCSFRLRNHQRSAVTVTQGFDSPKNRYGLGNHQRNAVTGDAWIKQPKQPLRSQKSTTNCGRGSRRDSTAQTAPRDSDSIKELVSRVTHGFDSPNSPLGIRNHQRIAVTGHARIRQPKHPLGT